MGALEKWAENFVSERNDTIEETQLRTKLVPPRPPTETTVRRYLQLDNRLFILGFNGTLTASVERKGDQYQETELTMHPEYKQPLTERDSDPKTTVVVISGSVRPVLDRNFNEYDTWLSAKNGIFLNPSEGEWVTIMPEQLNIEGGTTSSMFLTTLQIKHLDHILKNGKLHLYGFTDIHFKDNKLGTCCSISGHCQFLIRQLKFPEGVNLLSVVGFVADIWY